MSEGHSDEPLSPQQRLIELLTSDFTPEAGPSGDDDLDDNALKRFLRHARSIEEIDARMASSENMELGLSLADLLAPAAVTDSFKAAIVYEVRRAHARQTGVREAVSPAHLGLDSGAGIFDEEQAQQIEEQAIRGFGFDIIREYTVGVEGDTSLPQLVLRPGKRPADFIEAIDRLGSWINDFHFTYDKDAFEGLEVGAYTDAAPKAEVMPEGDPDTIAWSGIFEDLERLRDEHKREGN